MRFGTAASSSFVDIGSQDVAGVVFQFTDSVEILWFDRIHCGSGNGDCIEFQGALNNDIRIVNSEFSGNTGWALEFYNRNAGLTFTGNTVQSNAAGGIYLENSVGFTIDSNRFESNGATGITYTTPSTIINSDIHLNGESANQVTMERDGPCEGGTISYNVFGSTPTDNNIFIISATKVRIENNIGIIGSLVSSWGDTTYGYLEDVTVKYNGNDSLDLDSSAEDQVIDILSGNFGTDNGVNPELMHTVDFGLPPINLMEGHGVNTWIQIVSDGGFTFIRDSDDSSQRSPIFNLTNFGSTSDIVGVNITLQDQGKFRGRWMYFGVWVTPSATSQNGVGLYVEGTVGTGPADSTSSTTAYGTARRFVSIAFLVDDLETALQVGVRKIGTSNETIEVSRPVLALVGAPMRNMVFPDPRIHFGAAAPTAGTWDAGDIVWTTPAAGAPLLYRNSIAGTPGTFLAGAIPVQVGTDPSATCTIGALFFDTDSSTDTNCTTSADNTMCVCSAANTWTPVVGN